MEKKNEEDDGDTSGEYTSEDDGYVWPDGTRRRTREEWARYHKQVEESEVFNTYRHLFEYQSFEIFLLIVIYVSYRDLMLTCFRVQASMALQH